MYEVTAVKGKKTIIERFLSEKAAHYEGAHLAAMGYLVSVIVLADLAGAFKG